MKLTEKQAIELYRAITDGYGYAGPANEYLATIPDPAPTLRTERFVVTEEMASRFNESIQAVYITDYQAHLQDFVDTHFNGVTSFEKGAMQGEIDTLRQQLEAANQKARELEQSLTSANSNREALQAELKTAGEKIDDLDHSLAQASTYAQQLEDENAGLKLSPAQLRPIAEMPETVPEGCVRLFSKRYADGKWEVPIERLDGATYFIDIQPLEPEDTERREFETIMKSIHPTWSLFRNDDGDYVNQFTLGAWEFFKARKTKA